jgi:type IV secretion system protein VirB9
MLKILKKLNLSLILLSLSFYSFNLQAAQSPRFLGSEKKFRAYIYNPNEVYRYVGHYNYQGFIEFETGETINTISMGDSSLWLFEHLGNRLFLKPVADDASTNMTVITSKKIYHFELVAKEAKGITDPDLIFVVKFVYPDEKDKNIMEFTKAPVSDEPDMRNLNIYNFNYEFTGEPTLAPIKVFDNAEFTYFQFPGKSAEIPAVFSVDSAGFESMVNFRSAGDYIIVERISPQFTLRNGSEIVCVYNNNLLKSGRAVIGYDKAKAADKNKKNPLSSGNSAPFPSVNNFAPQPAPNYPAAPVMPNLNNSGPNPNTVPNYTNPGIPTMPNGGNNGGGQQTPSAPPSYNQFNQSGAQSSGGQNFGGQQSSGGQQNWPIQQNSSSGAVGMPASSNMSGFPGGPNSPVGSSNMTPNRQAKQGGIVTAESFDDAQYNQLSQNPNQSPADIRPSRRLLQ